MKYNQLGRTGLFVSEICLGTMTFGEADANGMWGQIAGVDQDAADQIVARAVESGVNFFDTADVYSLGESERILGQALRNAGLDRSDVVIATKVFGKMGDKPNQQGASRGHIMSSVEASLTRLGTSYVDLYQIHGTDLLTPIDETLRALDDLVSQGLVRYVGVSNWQAWRIAKALGISENRGFARFETVQSYYSIIGRDIEREIVPLVEEEKLGIMVWSPLAGGILSGKYGPDAPEGSGGRRTKFDFPPVNEKRAWAAVGVMREIAEKHSTTVPAVALAYVLAKRFIMSVILGAKSLDQLNQNLAATTLKLDGDDLRRLERTGNLAVEYPNWMIRRQIQGRRPEPFKPEG